MIGRHIPADVDAEVVEVVVVSTVDPVEGAVVDVAPVVNAVVDVADWVAAVELLPYVVGCDDVAVVGDAVDEPEELVEDEEEECDGLDSEAEVESAAGVDPTEGLVPGGKIDLCAALVTGPTWNTIIPASTSTTTTGTAPSAMGRTLSDVWFILSWERSLLTI